MFSLSILICHLPNRKAFLDRLNSILVPQLTPAVEVLVDDSTQKSTGKKRNDLLARASGKYLAFVDDDDRISPNYVSLIMRGIDKGVDCCSLVGEMTSDGKDPHKFIHSIKYKSYYEDGGVFYRYPNHLNCVKSEIIKMFSYPNITLGEDKIFATRVFQSGVLKTEHEIDDVIYYYDCRSVKE